MALFGWLDDNSAYALWQHSNLIIQVTLHWLICKQSFYIVDACARQNKEGIVLLFRIEHTLKLT